MSHVWYGYEKMIESKFGWMIMNSAGKQVCLVYIIVIKALMPRFNYVGVSNSAIWIFFLHSELFYAKFSDGLHNFSPLVTVIRNLLGLLLFFGGPSICIKWSIDIQLGEYQIVISIIYVLIFEPGLTMGIPLDKQKKKIQVRDLLTIGSYLLR